MQGVTSSKNDGFSLTSGDFPTLGSEKDNSGRNTESQGSPVQVSLKVSIVDALELNFSV